MEFVFFIILLMVSVGMFMLGFGMGVKKLVYHLSAFLRKRGYSDYEIRTFIRQLGSSIRL